MMKTRIRIALAIMAVMLLSLPLAAQNPQNLFKVNLFSPLVRTGSFFYERALNDDSSIQLGFFYSGASIGDTKLRGFGLTPEYRFYLSEKPAPRGIFVAPFARYQSFNLTVEGESGKASLSTIGGGLLVGVQTILKDRISLEAFIGPSYSSSKLDVTSGDEDDFEFGSLDGFGVRFGVTIGIAF
jgi:hypothetical protein